MTVTEYTQNEENNNRKSRRRRRWRAITGFHSKHLLKRCRYGCTSRWSTGTEDRGVMTASGYPRCEGVKFAWTEKRSVTTRHTGASAGMHISALENTPFYSRDYTLPLSGIYLSVAGITPVHCQVYTFLQPGLHPSIVRNTPFCSRGLSIFIRIFSMYVFLDYSQTLLCLKPSDFVIT